MPFNPVQTTISSNVYSTVTLVAGVGRTAPA